MHNILQTKKCAQNFQQFHHHNKLGLIIFLELQRQDSGSNLALDKLISSNSDLELALRP